MPDGTPEEPKIIIDSDWKSQAEREKQRLAAQTRPAASPEAPAAKQGRQPGEPARFEDLISMLMTNALMAMGAFPDQRTGQAYIAIDLAKLYVDLLGVLEEKTKGNLTEQEATTLSRVAHELRLEYVEIANAIAKAVEEGRISPMGQGVGKVSPAGAPPKGPGPLTP